MTAKPNRFWIAYAVVAGLILVRLAPLALGTTYLWGVGHLTLLPFGYLVAFEALALVVIVWPFLSSAEKWGEAAGDWFDRTFYQSKLKLIYRGLVILCAGLLFLYLRMPTHFLGDGYTFLANVGSEGGRWVKWSEGGALLVTMWVQRMIGGEYVASALVAFQSVSIVSGLVTLWFYFLIAEVISTDPIRRMLTFAGLVLSGSILLFFGYVESYPILWPAVAAFMYFSLNYLGTGKHLVFALVFLVLSILLHLQAAMFLPGGLYLVLSRGGGNTFYRKFKVLIWSGIAVGTVITLALFYREYSSNLFFENVFLYPFSGKPIAPGYSMVSLRHLGDLLNLFVLVVPLGLVWLAISMGRGGTKGKEPRSAFLGLLAAGSLLFLVVVDPSLSMPRDWDLFSLCWFVPGLWLIDRAFKAESTTTTRLAVPCLVLGLLSVGPFLLVNLDSDRSVAQIKQIIDTNPEKSLGSMSILSNYYREGGDQRGADSIGTRMAAVYPEFTRWRSAFQLLASGQREQAWQAFSQTRPDRFSKDFHSFLASYYIQGGQADSALVHARAAVQLQKYVDVNYAPLSYAYAMNGETDRALEALRDGYALNSRNKELVMGLALLFFEQGKYDSTVAYAGQYRVIDSSDPMGYFLAAKGYYGLKESRRAYQEGAAYLASGGTGPEFEQNCQELRQLMPGLSGDKK